IGAGRGSRLGPETAEIPKTLVPVMGRPMLDWVLEALSEGGFRPSDVVFVCGYAEEVIRARYPDFTFVRNHDWENNNILLSLLYAREHLAAGFVSSYADIVYEGAVVKKLVDSRHDIVLGCDTAWRRRYVNRLQHPETDAEKLEAEGSRVVRLSRHIASEQAQGEFIGVMKLSAAGAREFLDAFDAAKASFAGRTFREGRSFERAYLIDLLQVMLEQGSVMHRENTAGGYMEIDTLEDLAHAEQWWRERP
ncbi:MAG: NTP transferase domain-containing protein, partial [Steroidobacteraceae bacterium]